MMTAATKLKDTVPWEKSNDKPVKEHIKEQRLHLASKGPYSQTMVFPVVVYGCEIWMVKKAEH